MSVPSCVSFRDQDVLMDVGKPLYKDWTRLEVYCHILAAKKAMRTCMDGFEEVLIDGLKIAKELYRRGVIYKSSVDNCDPAQFADIPDFTINKNSFFSSMFRSIDNNFKYWFEFMDVLRMYPECREATDEMEKVYRKNLDELELQKYQGDIQVASPEEAKVLFESICQELDNLWTEARNIMDSLDIEKLKNNVRLCYLDEKEQTDQVKTREEMYTMLRKRLDIMNVNSFDTMMMGSEHIQFQERVRAFTQFRALTSARIRVKDFAYQLQTSPFHKPIVFDDDASMELRVCWDEDEVMFRFFFLMEVVFVTLTRHQYFHHIDTDTYGFWFYLPDWMRYAMVKLSRERTYSLVNEGVCRVTVLSEITVLDPRWNLSAKDHYDFFDSVIKIKSGRVDEVDDTLQGLKPFQQWESEDIDKRIESILDFVDDWPESIPVPPQTVTVTNFMSFYETNHIWVSHPFYTRKRGFKLCLIVYPQGTRNGRGTHLSVGACLMRGENDDHLAFPVKGELIVRLINRIGNHNHIQHTIEFNDKAKLEARQCVQKCHDFARIGVSINQFVPLALLDYDATRGTQYLAEDTIHLQVMHAKFVHRS